METQGRGRVALPPDWVRRVVFLVAAAAVQLEIIHPPGREQISVLLPVRGVAAGARVAAARAGPMSGVCDAGGLGRHQGQSHRGRTFGGMGRGEEMRLQIPNFSFLLWA